MKHNLETILGAQDPRKETRLAIEELQQRTGLTADEYILIQEFLGKKIIQQNTPIVMKRKGENTHG